MSVSFKKNKLSRYARVATEAMIQAQKKVIKENRRFGLPLIVANAGEKKQNREKLSFLLELEK